MPCGLRAMDRSSYDKGDFYNKWSNVKDETVLSILDIVFVCISRKLNKTFCISIFTSRDGRIARAFTR